jgi:arginase
LFDLQEARLAALLFLLEDERMRFDHLATVDLMGVRFDGSGRHVGQAGAATALRAAGLAEALPGAAVTADVIAPAPSSARGPSGFVNEAALLAMVGDVYERVRATLRGRRFPLVYGADCAVLLGAVPALRDTAGGAGLLFVDGHEDATTMEESKTGEAANMEIALLLGLTGAGAPGPLRRRLPALSPGTVVMMGQRDARFREEIGVASVADRVPVHPLAALRRDPTGITQRAVEELERNVADWWLHIDLDVLDGHDFPACDAATDPRTPGGLSWAELAAVTGVALAGTGCRGWSIGVYNTDLDPDGQAAQRIVRFLAEARRIA